MKEKHLSVLCSHTAPEEFDTVARTLFAMVDTDFQDVDLVLYTSNKELAEYLNRVHGIPMNVCDFWTLFLVMSAGFIAFGDTSVASVIHPTPLSIH